MTGIEKQVDARGLRCPMPVLRLRKAVEGLPAGAVIEMLATDPAAQRDIPAFCEEKGWTLISAHTQEGITRYRIQLG